MLAALEASTDPIERLALLDPVRRAREIARLPRAHRDELIARWLRWAHEGQCAPVGDWRVWLIRAGRGFGKTRAGAEWISALARRRPGARIALTELRASGVGDDDSVPADAAISGRSVAPPSPVHLRVAELADGSLVIGWTRRSRTGWDWRDGVDVPLSEEREAYQLTIARGDGAGRVIETDASSWTYPAPLLADDRSVGAIAISIRQIGTHAVSAPLTLTL